MSSSTRSREKEDEVVRLRLAGHDFDAIARSVGYRDRSGAWKAYRRALDRKSVPQDAAGRNDREDLDAIDLARLDELQKSLWPRANRGDLSAVDRVLKIMERREKILARGTAKDRQRTTEAPGSVVVPKDRLDELRERRGAAG